ncbi:MAG: hypothetical protein OXU25_01985 [Thaumarchaeota archaeon]|nr:hypothetical protein [Nitrososphaerota archaeon]
MAPGADHGWGWEDTCAVMTASLQKNGLFHWDEIRDVVDEDAYARMQWARGDRRVWVVRHSDIAPRLRHTMLDYAHVAGAELRGTGPSRHVVAGEPAPCGEGQGEPRPTCAMVEVEAADHELTHYVTHRMLGATGIGFVRDLMASFRDRIAMDVEREIQRQVGDAPDRDFAFVDASERRDRFVAADTVQDPLEAEKITNAAIRVVRNNPQVPFPRGLVCMLSPEQSVQLFGGGSARADGRGVFGIGTVTSPAVEFDRSRGRYVNVVAARNALRVALSRIEVEAVREKGGASIKARYCMGVSVDPRMAAKIFSYRK